MTFSIVARSDDGDSWGVAVASKFLAVGSAVPAAIADIGAIATQAAANVAWKAEGLALLDEGAPAEIALQRLVEDDEGRAERQAGIVDSTGGAATYTGSDCMHWAGGIAAEGVAIQGNILTGPEVVDAIKAAWDGGAALPFADRLVAALHAGDRAGGDSRGRQSAALLVVREGAGYGGGDDIAVDLRVDDHPDPVIELARLLELNDLYLTASQEGEKVEVTQQLREELETLAKAKGAQDFLAWVGTENYEMRVAEDAGWIDQRILAIIRM